MTTKELAYVEDALNHAKHFYWQCDQALCNIKDQTLKNFVSELKTMTEQMYNNLFSTISN